MLVLLHALPAIAGELLKRTVADLVGHARAAIDPVAKIDKRQTIARGAQDVVENDEVAQPLAIGVFRIVEGVDHRKAIALTIRQTRAHKAAGRAINGGLAILNQMAGDRRVFHHVGVIELIHRRHATIGMAHAKVLAEKLKLLVRRPRAAFGHDKVAVAFDIALLRGRRFELIGDHAHRDAGLTIKAAWAVSDRLAAAKTDPSKRFVQLVRMAALQLGEDLTLLSARQIGARRRARHEEAGEADRSRHGGLVSSRLGESAMSLLRLSYAHSGSPVKDP